MNLTMLEAHERITSALRKAEGTKKFNLTPLHLDPKARQRWAFLCEGPEGKKFVAKTSIVCDNLRETIAGQFEILATYHPLLKSERYRVPEPLSFWPAENVYFMEYITAEPIDFSQGSGNSQDYILSRVAKTGAWLSAFHALTSSKRRLDPEPIMATLRHKIRQFRLQEIEIFNPNEFERQRKKLRHAANAVTGREEVTCLIHGDCHHENILLDNTTVFGIDFQPKQGNPIEDILEFYLTALFQASYQRTLSEPITNIWSALIQGYNAPLPDTDIIEFYKRRRVAWHWLKSSRLQNHGRYRKHVLVTLRAVREHTLASAPDRS